MKKKRMGKQGDLCDDSALVKAFDAAIFKYKMMHSKGETPNDSTDGETISSDAVDRTGADIREEDENGNVRPSSAMELGVANSLEQRIKENDHLDSHIPEKYVDPSNDVHMNNSHKDASYSQATENYNWLLDQYYEIEEKRQKILQQLQQLGSSNYQYSGDFSGSGVQWGAWPSSQENQLTNQSCQPMLVCSCCPYVCQSKPTPCTSLPTCSLSAACVDTTFNDSAAVTYSGKSLPCADGDVRTAMGAAEKALSSMKMKPSVDSCKDEGNDNAKESEGQTAQSTSSETDLSVVLNAWYSAGFYTGKYLTEQRAARK